MNLAALKDRIEELPKHHHIEIARIIAETNTAFNENQNGIFVNMAGLHAETVTKMNRYVEHVALQEAHLKVDEACKGELKENFFGLSCK
jgi:hypothetical protein